MTDIYTRPGFARFVRATKPRGMEKKTKKKTTESADFTWKFRARDTKRAPHVWIHVHTTITLPLFFCFSSACFFVFSVSASSYSSRNGSRSSAQLDAFRVVEKSARKSDGKTSRSTCANNKLRPEMIVFSVLILIQSHKEN